MRQLFDPAGIVMAIGEDERAFFVALGARIARLRKEAGITQVQLAQTLEVSQQTVNAYEMGHRRVPVSMLPALARTLGVSVEALIGEPEAPARARRGPAPKLAQHMARISQLPKTKQRFVMEVLESVLAQAGR